MSVESGETSYVYGDSRSEAERDEDAGRVPTSTELAEFRRGWVLGYTQGQYNMRRTLLRKLDNPTGLPAITLILALDKWLREWPKKRRKKVLP